MINHPISPHHFVAILGRYRDLIGRLVVREFSAKYRGSMLGVIWAVVTPLMMVTVFVFVFGVVFQARWGSESTPKASFTVTFLLGMMVHGIFAEALARAPSAVLGNPAYVKKVVFPLEILPVVIVLNALVTAAIGLAIVLIIHLVLSGTVEPTLPLLPLVLAPFVLMVLGLVYFVGSIGVYFRDVSQIIGLVTLASMFMAPIFYPIAAVPEAFRTLLYLNPLTFPVEQARGVALYGQAPDWSGLAIYTAAGAGLAWLGYAWFQKTRKGFADVI
jgi:homopolymeric O-antigen transport system permease protein